MKKIVEQKMQHKMCLCQQQAKDTPSTGTGTTGNERAKFSNIKDDIEMKR